MKRLPEDELNQLDWNSLDQEERTELIVRQTIYLETLRKYVHSDAVYSSTLRDLFIAMFVVLALSFFNFDSKNIVLSLVASHIFFVIVSRIALHSSAKQLDEMKDSYARFIKSKKKII